MKIAVIASGELICPVWETRCIALSDIHENSAGPHDNCQNRLLWNFLMAHSPAKWDILNLGDWRDFWEEARGALIIRNNAWLEQRLAEYRTVVVWGNHDDVPGLSAPAYDLQTGALFASHGHHLDPACRGRGTVGRFGAGMWSAAERLGLGPIFAGVKDDIVRTANRRIKTASVRGAGNDVYIADARRRGKVLYFSGHTHKPELVELAPFSGQFYANPGSWTNPGRGYAVRVDGTRIELLEITEK